MRRLALEVFNAMDVVLYIKETMREREVFTFACKADLLVEMKRSTEGGGGDDKEELASENVSLMNVLLLKRTADVHWKTFLLFHFVPNWCARSRTSGSVSCGPMELASVCTANKCIL